MGNFLSILSGFTKGAADTYTSQAKEERDRQAANDKLIGDTLLTRASSPDVTPEEADSLLREGLTKHKVDKKTIESISQGFGYIRAKHEDDVRRQSVADTGGTPTSSPAPGGPPVSPAMPDPALPTKTLSDIPQRTMGQIAYERNRPQMMQAEQDKSNIELDRQTKLAQATREADRAKAFGEIGDKIDVFKKYEGTPEEDEVRYMLGMAPRSTGGGSGVSAGRPINGDAVKAALIAQGKLQDANAIDITKSYMVQLGPDRKTIVSALPATSPTVSSKPLVMDTATASRYQTDQMKNPLRVGQTYVPLHDQLGGAIVGFIPESELGTISQHPEISTLTNADGYSYLAITPVTTTTQKTAPGGQPLPAPGVGVIPPPPTGSSPALASPAPGIPSGPTGAVPSLPVNPRPPASGTGPTKAGAGGTEMRDLGVKKPLSSTEFTALNGAQEGLIKIQQLDDMLKADPNLLLKGAIPGTPGARTYDRFKKEMVDIISRLRTGAVINEQEETFYKSQLPGLMDAASERFFGDTGAVEKALDLHKALFQRTVDQFKGRAAAPGAFGEVPKAPGRGGNKPSLNDIFGGKK